MSVPATLLAIALCMLGGAFFAGMETGVVSLNRLRLRHLVRRRVVSAHVAERLLRRPELLLGATLAGTNLCYVMLSVFATRLAVDRFGAAGPAVASAGMTLLVLVVCEYLPKAWFQSFPARRVLPLVRTLDVFVRLFRPVSWLLQNAVERLLPGADEDRDAGALVSREELVHMAREGVGTGMLTPEESRMIRTVFALGGRTCGERMTPRERVVSVPHDAGPERIRAIAAEHGFNRYPVRHREERRIVGVLHLLDVLCDPDPAGKTARDYMRPPQYVPTHMPVDHVMPRMRVTGSPLVLVTDDAFEVVGIITLEDVLSEIAASA